ncbi:putative ATP-grasp-modified RiPP, partial [Streptomyces sp. NPDC055078]
MTAVRPFALSLFTAPYRAAVAQSLTGAVFDRDRQVNVGADGAPLAARMFADPSRTCGGMTSGSEKEI